MGGAHLWRWLHHRRLRSTLAQNAEMNPNQDHAARVGVINVQALEFRYGERRVVDVERFCLASSESVAVIGPSGCGKTTLMHLLAGLLRPASGTIEILGSEITAMNDAQVDRFRGRHIGMIFQRLYLLPALTVRENVELAQKLSRTRLDNTWIDSLLAQPRHC